MSQLAVLPIKSCKNTLWISVKRHRPPLNRTLQVKVVVEDDEMIAFAQFRKSRAKCFDLFFVDEFYSEFELLEGWFEVNMYGEGVALIDGDVTHWMALRGVI